MSKSPKQPYFRFFASDWLGGTRGMKAAEVGVYITLIAMMYDRCEPLPEDHKRLARQCGCSAAVFSGIVDMLVDDGKITRTEAGLWNARVEKEFKWREKNSQQSSDAAQERWKKSNENKDENMPTHTERNADGMPIQNPEARSQKEKDISLERDFDEWYAAYPKRVGRGQALKAYRAARRKAESATLLAAARRFSASMAGKDPTYIAHPSTWLNGERWLDDAAPTLALVEQPSGPRDPATFTLEDWVPRIEIGQRDPSRWPAMYGAHPPPNVPAPELARRYLEIHRPKATA